MQRKQNLASALGNQKKIGGNFHFPEIIKLQFGKKKKKKNAICTLLCILLLFRIIVA